MTHDSQWKHEAEWREMEGGKLPEGRKPLTWADLGVGPQSQALDDRDAWRAKAEELAQENAILRTEKHADAECIGHLERRVQELDGWADRLAEMLQVINAQHGGRNAARLLRDYRDFRAALKQEGLSDE